MDRIIEQLLSPDTNIINQATRDLEEASKSPQAIEALCTVMTTHQNADVRQYSAVLLRKKLEKLRSYQQVPASTIATIKNNLLNAIFAEKENFVRGAMTQFFGCVLRHEEHTDDAWVGGVIQFIASQCASNDAQVVENASFVMAKLADETPMPFVQRFAAVGQLLQAALLSTGNNVSATVMYNMLTIMSALVPVILGNEAAQQTYQEAVPYLINVSKKFADEAQIVHYTISLEVLQSMVECTPLLLNPHMRSLVEFVLGVIANKNYETEIRIKTLAFMSLLISEKKKLLVKQKLIEPIISVVFDVMASEPESDDASEFFTESDSDTILAAANVVVDTLAINMPPEKFIPPLLSLLEPALQNPNDELRRRASYIVLATISEGCREAICNKYLEPMLNILKQGLNDPTSSVRSAALYAVGQFSEQLQPEIAEHANEVLPQLLKYMQDILQAHQMGQQLEVKLVERLFYALEAFCENMDKGLAPFMESLMTMILAMLDSNFPQHFHMLVMELTEAVAKAYKGSLLSWFQPLIEKLRPLLGQQDNSQNDQNDLRAQALNTLAETARNIDQQFAPFAQQTMEQCVQWIETSDDPDVRKALLNIFGALASIIGEEMLPVLPIILNRIERCMDEGAELPPPQLIEAAGGKGDGQKADEIDLDETSDEESDSIEQLFMGDNPYLQEKDQAVYTLKEIAESCPRALLPYNQKLFESVYKLVEHPCADLRSSSISAAKSLVIKWYEQDAVSAKQPAQILLQKLIEIVHNDHENEVVIEAQDSIGDLLSDLGNDSLPTKQLRDAIARCISDGLTYQYTCQFASTADNDGDDDSQDEDDSESDKAVIEGAANLLTPLGKAVSTEEYVAYFKQLEPMIMKHFKKSTASDLQSTRGFIIGVLAECYAPLGTNVAPYFTHHLNILIRGAKERNVKTRQNSIFALGELVRAARDVSYGSFPLILNTLSEIVVSERKRVIVDNIVGALARLILTNTELVPLDHVLPAMLQKLPIEDDLVEANIVIECFKMLFQRFPERMVAHAGPFVVVAVQMIANPEFDADFVEEVVLLVNVVRTLYPGDYQQALTNPALAPMLALAQERAGGRLYQ